MMNVYEELSETSRRQILAELRSGSKNVTDIVTATGLKQPNVSNHLARMRARGIVKANKVGRQVYYALASPEVEAVVQAVFSVKVDSNSALDWERLSKQYAKAAIQGDEPKCSEILDTAFRAQASLLDIYEDLLAPAMALVGTWYKVEAIDEAQEHLASGITERMMARTIQITGPARRNNLTAIIGCASNAWHVIGLRMISDYLRFCGWKTLFLGANVPVRSFMNAVEQHRPSLVLVSCGSEDGEVSTLDLIHQLAAARDRKRSYLIGAGGRTIAADPEKFRRAGADFTASDLRTFAAEILPAIEQTGELPNRGVLASA